MANTIQANGKALTRQGRHLEQHRTKKVNLLRSITRCFNRAALRKKQTALSTQVVRTRMTPTMTDQKQRYEIVPRILSWTRRPSPLKSVTTQQEGAESPALLEEKKARYKFNDGDEDSSGDALTAFREACEWWTAKGKVGSQKEAKEKALRKMLAEKAEKSKMEVSGI